MVVVLAFVPVATLVFFVWWKIAGEIAACRGVKDWVARGACCPMFIRKHNSGRPLSISCKIGQSSICRSAGFYQISALTFVVPRALSTHAQLPPWEKLHFISVDMTNASPGPCISSAHANSFSESCANYFSESCDLCGFLEIVQPRKPKALGKGGNQYCHVSGFTQDSLCVRFQRIELQKKNGVACLAADLPIRRSGAGCD